MHRTILFQLLLFLQVWDYSFGMYHHPVLKRDHSLVLFSEGYVFQSCTAMRCPVSQPLHAWMNRMFSQTVGFTLPDASLMFVIVVGFFALGFDSVRKYISDIVASQWWNGRMKTSRVLASPELHFTEWPFLVRNSGRASCLWAVAFVRTLMKADIFPLVHCRCLWFLGDGSV